MPTRADIVAEARRWIDTGFQHQARTRGVATDCGGLLGGVAIASGVLPADWWTTTFDPLFGGYSRQPDGTLRRICEAFMREIAVDAMQPGDAVLMRFAGEPQHVGILADYVHGGLSIVHAMLRVGRVAEHRLAPKWRGYIVAAYAMPGVSS
jgi:cell wall-associated NlpC family hydrolase